MEILRALQIERREWENIRASLQKCADIGEFDSKINSRFTLVSESSLLVRNLIEMENKLLAYGYSTQEAAYVFTILASRAGERLGLIGELAQTFGSGYSWVRTGRLSSNETEKHHLKQMIFFKFFFPLGGDLRWDFNSPLVKVKLRIVFDKFFVWQNDPRIYIQDLRDYKAQLELLRSGLFEEKVD
jgi:hypothetical protein